MTDKLFVLNETVLVPEDDGNVLKFAQIIDHSAGVVRLLFKNHRRAWYSLDEIEPYHTGQQSPFVLD